MDERKWTVDVDGVKHTIVVDTTPQSQGPPFASTASCRKADERWRGRAGSSVGSLRYVVRPSRWRPSSISTFP